LTILDGNNQTFILFDSILPLGFDIYRS